MMSPRREKTIKEIISQPFAPRDIIIVMSHVEKLTEDLWKEFLKTNPDNSDICFAICNSIAARERCWEELLKRGPSKEDLLYLFEHLRNMRFLNYYVWEVFNKRKDLTRKDLEKVLESKKIDGVTIREAKRMMLRFPEEKDLAQPEPDKNPVPEKSELSQTKNDFIVKKKKRQNPPWERDYRDPLCG